jgi:Cu/Ag efflux pump CusA
MDAGIVRLRPVMITVGATILALFPLAVHGGPLWQPLCYAQIGGLGVATFVTLLLGAGAVFDFCVGFENCEMGRAQGGQRNGSRRSEVP